MNTKEQMCEIHKAERAKCTVYTRVMGYHRPVETINLGKKGDFRERCHFSEPSVTKVDNSTHPVRVKSA